MSGIVGYIGRHSAQPVLLDCLKKLDYRGYDSAGIAVSDMKTIGVRKEKGRVEDLEASSSSNRFPPDALGSATQGGHHTECRPLKIPIRYVMKKHVSTLFITELLKTTSN